MLKRANVNMGLTCIRTSMSPWRTCTQSQHNPDPTKEELSPRLAQPLIRQARIHMEVRSQPRLPAWDGSFFRLMTTANVQTPALDQIEHKPSSALPQSTRGLVYRQRMIAKGETPPSSSSSMMTEDLDTQPSPSTTKIRKP
ncbi:unnamed protein product [Schistocephalus solidus]|uniref:Uncharacterized protein n=1 Tax=Schistocephalus solidus TaxID=70667 RepID=A0A183T6U1_SCHSO|nr:unnamed protein product [Schistocephalus solidus]